MNLIERIEYIIKNNEVYPGINESEFARSIGTYPTKISEIKSGKVKSLSPDLALEISKKFKVEFLWLLTGEGEPFINSSDIESVKIPERGEVECSAGEGCNILNEAITGYIALDRELLKKVGASLNTSSIVKVRGDSMYPTLNPGDKVLVDTSQKEIIDGQIYIIRIDDDIKIKRLHKLSRGRVEVISDNKNYRADVLEPEKDNFEICGKVLWSIVYFT